MLLQPAPSQAPPWNGANVHLWWRGAMAGDDVPRARRARLDALLRDVLSRYLALAPAALSFAREARGRPYLLNPSAPDFNLSDTRGGTVIAVARQSRIGVDLEHVDRMPPHRRLARRYFSTRECEVLETLPDDDARRAFLRLWTAKEASCKATGTGIYGQLHRWLFSPLADAPELLALPEEAGHAARWHHLRVAPAADYTAVIACEGFAPRVAGFALAE